MTADDEARIIDLIQTGFIPSDAIPQFSRINEALIARDERVRREEVKDGRNISAFL